MRRVSVVGNSGSGKSTLARRIADCLAVPYIEIDAIHHLPDWTPIAPDEFMAEAERLAATDEWVVDGNYRNVVVDGPFWRRADTVVWLALPRSQVMRQLVPRTVRRVLSREELWNGNTEPLANLAIWREASVVNWAWTQHNKYVRRFGNAMIDARYAHLNFVKLESHKAADEWLAELNP